MAKRMKIDPHCQRRNCSPLNVDHRPPLQQCIKDYVDISWRSGASGCQTREGWVKSAVFYL